MPLAIRLQDGKTVSTRNVTWRSRPLDSRVENKLVILMAVHPSGATLDILTAHGKAEVKAAAQWIMAKAVESGDERVPVTPKDVLAAVRREAKARWRAQLAAEAV